MPRRRIEFTSDEFYHIYNRGNNKDRIFFEQKNYAFFFERFEKYVSQGDAVVHAYCLLPNHYHILVQILDAKEFLKKFERFLISYVKSVNEVYGRVGHLFQGRFQAKHVETEEYLLHLSRYIHLNPVFAGLVKQADEWEFSSYREYLGRAPEDSRSSLRLPGRLRLPESYRNNVSGTPGVLPEPLRVFSQMQVHTQFILSRFGSVEEYRVFVESFGVEEMRRIEETLWK